MIKKYKVGDIVILLSVLVQPTDRSSDDLSKNEVYKRYIGKPITITHKARKVYRAVIHGWGVWFCDEDVMPLTELGKVIYE